MEKDFWLKVWEEGNIPFHQEMIDTNLLNHVKKLQLSPGDEVLVPLCGKTKDMIWLAYQGYQVTGIEVSPIACKSFFDELSVKPEVFEEKYFVKYRYKNIDIICGDLFELTSQDIPTIHAIYDCKALVALPATLREKYVNHLFSIAGTDIKILLLALQTSCLVNGPPFSIDDSEINSLYGKFFNIVLIERTINDRIPNHLVEKGYKMLTDSVYLLTAKTHK